MSVYYRNCLPTTRGKMCMINLNEKLESDVNLANFIERT